ncbi:hypothetical protein CLV98_101578 [Dyadobacter jejuensis]|uniref:O-antigen/teichoic acid export membrane protein n=1 Tax=Dyadobacter jejuensis TaxID=1082580 RepID=A0A316ASZ7_9BACT|nr:hypothetical protein [Dyadobacter jejuensis]PWJ60394.1 hypothetical protein CLV98_101578 [Dyadobacter jejuensis]
MSIQSLYGLIKKLDLWNSPTLMTWLSYAARSVTNLGLLVFVLNRFTPEDNVLWNLFATIVGMQLLVDFGFRQTFSRFIAYAFGGATEIGTYANPKEIDTSQQKECNLPLMTSIVSSMILVYRWLTALLFALLCTFGTWSMLKPLSSVQEVKQAWIAWIIVVVSTCVVFYSKLYLNFLEGLNKIALVRRVEVYTSAGTILSSYLVLIWSPTVLNLMIASQFWLLAGALRDFILCRRVENGLFKNVSIRQPVGMEFLKKIWTPAWRSGISGLMSGGVTSMTSLVYAQFGSSVSVASYLLALRIMSQIREVSMAPFYSKIPLLSILRVKHDLTGLLATVKRAMKLSHMVFVFGFICVSILINPFLDLIGSKVAFVDMDFWCLLGAAIFANRFGTMHLHTYTSTNHVITHIADSISGCLYIAIAWLLSGYIGPYSIPFGMLVGYVFLSWFAATYSYRSLNVPVFWRFESKVSFPYIFIFILFSALIIYFTY